MFVSDFFSLFLGDLYIWLCRLCGKLKLVCVGFTTLIVQKDSFNDRRCSGAA